MIFLTISIAERPLWFINAHNDGTGTDAVGNYDVEVWEVGRGACGKPKPALRNSFRVEGFDREQGALRLAQRILNENGRI